MHVFCHKGRYSGRGFARHWHDLARLDDAGFADPAIGARDIAAMVAEHKQAFFREKASDGSVIDYFRATGGELQLIAVDAAYAELEQDYALMIGAGLLTDDAEPFEALMARTESIQSRANAAAAANS